MAKNENPLEDGTQSGTPNVVGASSGDDVLLNRLLQVWNALTSSSRRELVAMAEESLK